MEERHERSDQSEPVIGVLIVQSHPLLGSTIGLILDSESGIRVFGIVRTGHEAAEEAARQLPAVVLMDFSMDDMSGSAAASLIRAASPGVAIVVLGSEDSETQLLDAIDSGAVGYLTRQTTAAEIVEAVRRASRGDVLVPVRLLAKALARKQSAATKHRERDRVLNHVTPREHDVLRLLALGLDTNTMSSELGISPHTVEWHVRHLMEKLDVHSKLQLVIRAAALGMITV
jgi:DNA-binding NarL/FixJ family response regulator